VKSELELELAQEEMKKYLRDAENSIKAPMQALTDDLRQSEADINRDYETVAQAAGSGHRTEAGNIAAEMDVPPEAAAPPPDGPVDERPEEPGPDETPPKQGALW